MTATSRLASGAVARAEVEQQAPTAPVADAGPFVLNLCSSTTPMALAKSELPELKRFSFFVSRRFEEGRERFRLHMGYFATLSEAEEWLNVVRDIYPGAWAGEAPGKKLRERAAAAAAAQAQQAAGPPPLAAPAQAVAAQVAVPASVAPAEAPAYIPPASPVGALELSAPQVLDLVVPTLQAAVPVEQPNAPAGDANVRTPKPAPAASARLSKSTPATNTACAVAMHSFVPMAAPAEKAPVAVSLSSPVAAKVSAPAGAKQIAPDVAKASATAAAKASSSMSGKSTVSAPAQQSGSAAAKAVASSSGKASQIVAASAPASVSASASTPARGTARVSAPAAAKVPAPVVAKAPAVAKTPVVAKAPAAAKTPTVTKTPAAVVKAPTGVARGQATIAAAPASAATTTAAATANTAGAAQAAGRGSSNPQMQKHSRVGSGARPNALVSGSNVREVLAALDETTGETRMMPAPALSALGAADDAPFTDTQVLKLLEARQSEDSVGADSEVDTGSISLLKPDDTGTRRALKEAVTQNAPVSFAVQLQWSVQPVELNKVPPLAIFSAYTLYTVEGSRDGRKWYGLRLGFFTDAVSAKQVAHYVRSEFASVAVVPVSQQERVRASDNDKRPAAELAFPKKTRVEHVDEFKLIDSDEPRDHLKVAGAPAAANASGTAAASAAPAPGKRTAVQPPANAKRNPRTGGRVRAREQRSPQTLEETLEILGASELEIDSGNGETMNESGVRHLRVEVQKNSPFSRLLERLSERTRKP